MRIELRCLGRVIAVVLLYLFVAGCASLPKIGPFVDASNQLRNAVAVSGSTVEAELRLIPNGAGFAEQLKTQWEARNRAFSAMTDYSSALQTIVDAGNEGAASAQRVADSVTKLAESVGVYPGARESVAAATDITKFVYAQIALVRSAKSLRQAMEAAQPAVEELAVVVHRDLKDLEMIFMAAATEADNGIRKEFQALTGYRKQLLKQMGDGDPTDTATLAQQVQWAQLLQGTAAPHDEYLTRRKAVEQRLRAGRALIQAAAQSSSDWAAAHRQVLTAVQERRPVNTESLVRAASEIQQLVLKVRAI